MQKRECWQNANGCQNSDQGVNADKEVSADEEQDLALFATQQMLKDNFAKLVKAVREQQPYECFPQQYNRRVCNPHQPSMHDKSLGPIYHIVAFHFRIRQCARTVTENEKQQCGKIDQDFHHACLADEGYTLACFIAEENIRKAALTMQPGRGIHWHLVCLRNLNPQSSSCRETIGQFLPCHC